MTRPKPVRLAQQNFEERMARTLNEMPDYLDGKVFEVTESSNASFARPKASVQNFGLAGIQRVFTAAMGAFLALAARIRGLMVP